MISMRRISLGGGFRYLMESVAVGDGAAQRSNDLARYYAESGTPPGVFLGAGLAGLDGGRGVTKGSTVTEEHLRNMLGACCDPVTGEPVGRTPNASAKLPPVAGFDLTFSPSKSVSVAWAFADEGTKAVIYECHRRAVDYVLTYAEKSVLHSRSGANGIIEEDIDGAVAASFTHWDSRAGDPQLHDHLVVWNRARSASDGKWRTLDSRGLFHSRSTLSAMHQGVLSDLLTEALGVGWDARTRHHSDRARWEITGVPEQLMREFSQRADQIDAHKVDLIAAFVTHNGRQPTGVEVIRLRQQATLATRPAKTHRSLAEMTDQWRQRAASHLGDIDEQLAWVTAIRGHNDLPLLRADDLAGLILDDAAAAVTTSVGERRATFRRDNLLDDAHRLLHGVRFASPDDRVAVADRIADLAVDRSLALTPVSPHHTPARYLRPDGSSRLHPRNRKLFTTQTLLDAEGRLLDAGRRLGGPTVDVATVARVVDRSLPGTERTLSIDQALAVEKITTSGRCLDVLVGPAGTGKSTTMAGLRAAWEAVHCPGSVVGLAPSAAAAEVLADELGLDTENTAKWLTEHRRLPSLIAERRRLRAQLPIGRPLAPHPSEHLSERLAALDADIARWQLRPGQLVIVDEASLAGTFALDELVAAAADTGAKVLLVGDWAQLSAVDAGGAFGLLARDRPDLAPELTDVHRFNASWEKAASVELRLGHPSAIYAYDAHDRIVGGQRDELLDAVYDAWQADTEAGRSSLMIAADTATVADLNRRARAGRVTAGAVVDDGLPVAGGQDAGVGDEVITRQNNRLLTAGGRWVKNGDRWIVTATNTDGSMAVRRAGGSAETVLPAAYVAEHVELGYASTAHRAQGRTVDTAHVLVSPTTTREVLYVSATRGRESNQLYVDISYDPDPQTGHSEGAPPKDVRDVLIGVLANQGADFSAHEERRRVQDEAQSWATLHAEYQTIARAAQADRWESLLERSGLNADELEQVRYSEAHGPLLAALGDAAARGLDIDEAFPQLVQARSVAGAGDAASVLHRRVDKWAEAAASRRPPSDDLITGLVPRATQIHDPDMAHALADRERAMEERARLLAHQAVTEGAAWLQDFVLPPDHALGKRAMEALATVTAYRDRWGLDDDRRTLGDTRATTTLEQLAQRQRALNALAGLSDASVSGNLQQESDAAAADLTIEVPADIL
jgi:conjugative relaxase-like TrwC/TraI family protein